jgi:hypothetical protein
MRYTMFAYDLASVQLAVSRPISDRPFFRHEDVITLINPVLFCVLLVVLA